MYVHVTAVAICFSLLLPAAVLHGADFSVTTVSQLENALAVAESNDEDDTIRIAAGTYKLTASLNYDSYNFNEKKKISLQGIGGNAILDGGGLNKRILFLRTSGNTADITLRNIILTNGYAPEYSGGAGLFINIAGSDLTLENCQITNCFAGAFYGYNHGGGAYITAGIGSNVSIRNSVIAGNSAKGLGGGLYLSLTDGTLTFVNNTIVNNHNKSSIVESGGGIYLRLYFDSAVARLYNNILWANSYAHGDGDLYLDDAEYDPEKGAAIKMYNNNYKQVDWHLGSNLTLSDNISLAPLLSPDFRLPVDSPCLDAGTSDAPWFSSQDLEGDPRSIDGNCDGTTLPDMGADEYYRPPTVSTAPLSEISSTTATGGGTVLDQGGHAVSTRGICWSTSPAPTLADTCTDNGNGLGAFVSSLTGLTAEITYAVRAYASNCEGTSYGEEQLMIPTSYPTLSTTLITDINAPTATGKVDVLGGGDTPITAKGVCWSTSPNPTLADNCTNNGSGTENYTSFLTGLNDKTTYYIRAYASNNTGTAYSPQASFYAKKRFPWSMFVPLPGK